VGDAIQRELARLFAEQGVPASLGRPATLPVIDGGGFQVSSQKAMGVDVAQAIYGGLKR
jgi:hypothetical protein